MPSSKPMLPGAYPAHWESAVTFLAVRWEVGEFASVIVERALTDPRCSTLSTRARAMRISMQRNLAWGELLHRFAECGAFAITISRDEFGKVITFAARKRVDAGALLPVRG